MSSGLHIAPLSALSIQSVIIALSADSNHIAFPSRSFTLMMFTVSCSTKDLDVTCAIRTHAGQNDTYGEEAGHLLDRLEKFQVVTIIPPTVQQYCEVVDLQQSTNRACHGVPIQDRVENASSHGSTRTIG